MGKVSISMPALITLIVSSVEVYTKEAYGILIGKRKKNSWQIGHAITFQSARRHYDWIEMNVSRIRRINTTVKFLSNQKYVGDFHSHADRLDGLSTYDKKEIIEEKGKIISILVNVNKRGKSPIKKWRYDRKNKMLQGPIGEKFIVKISAFGLKKRKRLVVSKFDIRCPYIRNLNRIVKGFDDMKKELEKLEKVTKRFEKKRKNIRKKLARI